MESSFAWLFETWLTAMFGRRPISFTTDQGKAMEVAVAKVFPTTRHRLCRWHILSRCKKKLSDVCNRYPTFYVELKKCVNESDTAEIFEVYWRSILDKYGLRENTWLQLLYSIRHKWIPAYLKSSFYAELSTTQKLESMNRFYRNNFDKKISLHAFIAKFDQAMDCRFEKEAQEDLAVLHDQRILKTDAPLEKQAANIYTRAVFEKFQVELFEALDHSVKIQDGAISKFSVERDGDAHSRHIVFLNASEKKACCSCSKFEFAGILCSRVLAVFLVTGVILLPEHYILKRWTRKAKSGLILEDDRGVEFQNYCQSSPILRYNDLVHDAMKCAEKGAASAESYEIVKDILQKALAEIVALHDDAAKAGPHHAENM